MNKINIVVAVAACVIMTVDAVAVRAQDAEALRDGRFGPYDESPKIALAYVESGRSNIPHPDMFTHLIYAFADFNDNCDGVVISRPEKLRKMAELKIMNPELKVILGVGGYKREGFSEMARDKKKRKAFVKNVRNIIDSLKLDGVDLDWEFPTTEAGGHTATPQDDKNYVLVVKDLRKALGKKRWLSFYSYNTADFIDFKNMVLYVDYVHVSGYNLAAPSSGKLSGHQCPLYSSKDLGGWCVMKGVEKHMNRGVPRDKILIGIPFFGRGRDPFPSYLDCKAFEKYDDGMTLVWDDEAMAPYYVDSEGRLVLGFDDERSIKAKMDFVRANALPGVFVWNYDSDFGDHRLGKTIQYLRK